MVFICLVYEVLGGVLSGGGCQVYLSLPLAVEEVVMFEDLVVSLN